MLLHRAALLMMDLRVALLLRRAALLMMDLRVALLLGVLRLAGGSEWR